MLYHLYVYLKKYSKLVNITEEKQIHRYREQTSVYHWVAEGEGEGPYRGRGKKVVMKLYEIMSVKLLKFVNHYRI